MTIESSELSAPRVAAGMFLDPQGFSAEARYRALRRGFALSACDHYGTFRFSGARALDAVNQLVVSDVVRLPVRRAFATFMLRKNGRLLADAYVVNNGDGYTLTAEGPSFGELRDEVASVAPGAEDLTHQTVLVSVDGPFAWELMKDAVGVGILGVRYLDSAVGLSLGGISVTVLRGGKTGEFGYLIAIPRDGAPQALRTLTELGKKYDVVTCTLADIDICKLENRVVNPQREGAVAQSVLELNCRVMVSRRKGDYVGRAAVEEALEQGIRSRLIGLRCEVEGADAAQAFRIGAEVTCAGAGIGTVANTAYSPLVGHRIGLAFIDVAYAHVGLDVEVGGVAARTVSAPFVVNRSLTVRPQEDSYLREPKV